MNRPPLPNLTLDEATCIYGAGVLEKHLKAFEEETAGVRAEEKDIEFIHKARVATRRLRAALPLFSGCFPNKKSKSWLKEIRKVTKALGEARDADVQIDRLETFAKSANDPHVKTGINRLMLRLKQKRAGLQAPVIKVMEKLDQHGLVDEMRNEIDPVASRKDEVYIYTSTLYQNSFNAITRRLDDFMAYESIVHQPEKVAELHEMRIAAKWLRYTMENFSGLYSNQLKPYLQTIRQVQELLGEIHDCDVWLAFLPAFLQEEQLRMMAYLGHSRPFKRFSYGLEVFLNDRQQARTEQYEEFTQRWDEWQQSGIWNDLRKTLQVPFPHPRELYPSTIQHANNSEKNSEPQTPLNPLA